MKKLLCIVIFLTIAAGLSFAGEIRTTPKNIVISDPLTDKVELISIEFFYGSNPSAVLNYSVLDASGRVFKRHSVSVQNTLDDPATGANEATTVFTDFVATYGNTLYTRADAIIWAHILKNYSTVSK